MKKIYLRLLRVRSYHPAGSKSRCLPKRQFQKIKKGLSEDTIVFVSKKNMLIKAIEQSKKITGNTFDAFELDDEALNGKAGLFTHTNYRKDKSDCSPQPELLKMILELK